MKGSQKIHRHSRQHGFTLIELLTAIAIVSVLGMVATPLYQEYALKSKIGTGVANMLPLQRLTTEHYVFNNLWPADNGEAGANAPDTYKTEFVTSITITDTPHPGSIILTYDNSKLRVLGSANTLIYYPEVNNTTNITWKCDEGTLKEKYKPADCRA